MMEYTDLHFNMSSGEVKQILSNDWKQFSGGARRRCTLFIPDSSADVVTNFVFLLYY